MTNSAQRQDEPDVYAMVANKIDRLKVPPQQNFSLLSIAAAVAGARALGLTGCLKG